MELFRARAGLVMTPIPYKGGADALNDLIGGRIGTMFLDIASGLPQIRGGKVRALAVASEKRVAALPDLPTKASRATRLRGLGVAGVAPAGPRDDEAKRRVREGHGRSGGPEAFQRVRAADQRPSSSRRT
jgi:tripartite-type tricarboxylate transporter receptor subunit TctC